jgi:competence protein ComEA
VLEQAAPTRREAAALGVLALALAAVLLARWWSWQAPAPPLAMGGAPAAGVLLDVNAATWWELDALPGVGEALARRIVDDRARNGPFASVDDLARVPGVGAASLSRWRPFLTIGRAAPPARD